MDAKNNPFRNMTTQLYWEQQLWRGNESVEIRYVNGSFVAGTSASSPGIPRHMHIPSSHISHERAESGFSILFDLNAMFEDPDLIFFAYIGQNMDICPKRNQY